MQSLQLDSTQQAIVDAALAGKNIFITGSAGTGKSTLLNAICSKFRETGIQPLVCAPTGTAAVQCGGITVHRAFNIPIEGVINTTKKGLKMRAAVSQLVKNTKVIIIDEISMLRMDIFDSIAISLNKARKKDGQNRQLICIGDFYQLPPVLSNSKFTNKTLSDSELLKKFYGRDVNNAFCFESTYWNDFCFTAFDLKTVYRQNDMTFVNALNGIRVGDHSQIDFFNRYSSKNELPDSIYVCATRAEAERINAEKLSLLTSPGTTYNAFVSIPNKITTSLEEDVSYKYIEHHFHTITDEEFSLFDSIQAPPTMHLQLGARVMTVVNGAGYINGSIGTIVSLAADEVGLILDNKQRVKIQRNTWTVYDYIVDDEKSIKKVVRGYYAQFPLRLAYAITIHKSQGASYNQMTLNPTCFSPGQLYVALSRARSVDGIRLTCPIEQRFLVTDQSVIEFYTSLQFEGTSDTVQNTKHRGRPRKSKSLRVPIRIPVDVIDDVKNAIAKYDQDPDRYIIACIRKDQLEYINAENDR